MDLVDRLAAIPYSGAFSDLLDEMGYRDQVLPAPIQPMAGPSVVVGRAVTVRGELTSSMDPDVIFRPYLRMLGSLTTGDVIVSQPNDHTIAHFGELSAETAQLRGARGAVIDGGTRDADYINKLGFPVFARYRTPMDINGRWCLTDMNVPITIGNVNINPGDYIHGDIDGVVVIPAAVAEEAVTIAEKVIQEENQVRAAILKGVHPVEAFDTYGRF